MDQKDSGVRRVEKNGVISNSRTSVIMRDDEFDDDELDAQDWSMVDAGKDLPSVLW